jgi:hypothetical protein
MLTPTAIDVRGVVYVDTDVSGRGGRVVSGGRGVECTWKWVE